MIKLLGGCLALLMGVSLAGWLFFNLFIHRVTEYQGRPYPAMMFCAALIYVGQMWFRDGWSSLQSSAPRKKKSSSAAKSAAKPKPKQRPLDPLNE